jgi:hypothetical protein
MFLFLVLSSYSAFGSMMVRPQTGIGFTDNANYEETDKDADFFWWVRSSNSFISKNSDWNLWLNYRGYFKEHENDALTYRLGDTLSLKNSSFGDYDWDFGVGGQKYSNGSPATTEETFDNVYFETSILKTWVLQNNLDLNFEPLYQYKYYPQFDGRADHTALFNFLLDWNFSLSQSLNPFAEIGFVSSNQNLYSRNYFEFGTDWKISAQPDLKFLLHFMNRFSSFPDRQVSEATVITNKNGKVRATSQNETESQTLTQVQGTVVKILQKTELKGTVALSNQSSKSGYETYSELEVLGSVLFPIDF